LGGQRNFLGIFIAGIFEFDVVLDLSEK
jgi:hypothetical protein